MKLLRQILGGLWACLALAWYRDPQDQHRPSPGQFKANHESIGQKGFIRKQLLAAIFALAVLYPFLLLVSWRGTVVITLVVVGYVTCFIGVQMLAAKALDL